MATKLNVEMLTDMPAEKKLFSMMIFYSLGCASGGATHCQPVLSLITEAAVVLGVDVLRN